MSAIGQEEQEPLEYYNPAKDSYCQDKWMVEARRVDEELKSLWLGIKTWLKIKPF